MSESAPLGPIAAGTTRDLPVGADYERFCDEISPVYIGVRPDRASGRFAADFALFELDRYSLGVISTPGVGARRDRELINRIPDDAVFVNTSVKSWGLGQNGTAWSIGPGSAVVLDNAVPFKVVADPYRRLDLVTVRIGRELLPARVRTGLSTLNERLADTPIGAQLGAQIRLMTTALRDGMPRVASAMGDAVLELLDAAGTTGSGRGAPTRAETFRAHARTRLADPAFDLSALAKAFACTPRTVQSAFARDGETFSGWLRMERLDLARTALRDPANATRSIAEVAAASGFSDVGTFHRAYRARFGRRPSEDR